MLVAPMRQDLVQLGFQQLQSASDVDEALGDTQEPTLLVVNSVCGCAAGALRPAVALSLTDESSPRPARLTTVFAGQDLEATERARTYLTGYPPSSPAVALLKEGELVFMLERHQIEGYGPDMIATVLKNAYEEYCAAGNSPTTR
jgi:putative YphP/YqiW family bacilliredoxin